MTTQPQTAELDDDLEHDAEEVAPPSLMARVGAEVVGTFVLMLAIMGTAIYGSISINLGALPVALAGGLALAAMAAAFGGISGAHLNPAVTLGMATAGRFSWADVLPYWMAQVIGAIAAGGVVRALVPTTLLPLTGDASAREFLTPLANGYGEHSPLATVTASPAAQSGMEAASFTLVQVLLVEAVATAILVGVVIAATKKAPMIAPLAIGVTLTVAILLAAPISNAAINPVRATGIAFFTDSWALEQLWLFWLAPVVGGAIAGLVALMVDGQPVAVEEWDDEDEEDDEDDEEEAAVDPESDEVSVPEKSDEVTEPDETEELVADPASTEVAEPDENEDTRPPSA